MKYETTFNFGDKVWVSCFESGVAEMTVGKITIEHTKSIGKPGSMFDNYKPQESFEEKYMMEETGIGSGNIYSLNLHVFKTKAEALIQWKKYYEQTKTPST